MPNDPKSPWAVICLNHQQVFLTKEQYDFQMNRPDRTWECPLCGETAKWDDDNYEEYLDQLENDE